MLKGVLPQDVLTVVTGDGTIGAALAGHAGVDKVMFTGSTRTGKKIIASSADTIKRVTVELGGNDAGVVLPDADPAAIAEGVFWGAFINTGQTCAALKRLYVHDSMYDAMCQALVDYAKNVPMGVGMDEANALGPLQNKAQYDIVTRLVDAARDSGARILMGGNPDTAAKGYFYPTTLVAAIDNDNPLVTEEQFGPAPVSYTHLDVYKRQRRGLRDDRHRGDDRPGLQQPAVRVGLRGAGHRTRGCLLYTSDLRGHRARRRNRLTEPDVLLSPARRSEPVRDRP